MAVSRASPAAITTSRLPRPPRASRTRLPVYEGPFGPEQAERLLWRAGFGPRAGETECLAVAGLRGAVLSLTRPASTALVGPAPVTEDGQPISPDTVWGHDVLWWLDRMVRTEAPLIERMTLTWHDWFATSNDGVGSHRLMLDQNETQRRLCLSSFGELFAAMTIDPAMLVFLSGTSNMKGAANENYAREMQEIFTLGSGDGYSERDVREHARALTGWMCTWNQVTKEPENFRYSHERHDEGVKVIYGKRGRFAWRDSVRLALSHPTHPRHFVTKLWSYFSSQPLSARDTRAAESLYVSSGRQIAPMVEVMLMHPLLYEGPRLVKPPVVQIAGMLRASGRFIDAAGWYSQANLAGQMPFYPPNVSGWDETRWLNTGTWLARFNLANYAIGEQRALVPNVAKGTVPADPRALVEQAKAFWGSPILSQASEAALLSFAQAVAVDLPKKRWEKEQFPVMALNALRSLVTATPDYHAC
ncbi:MAG: DUF1800 family protein [Solirubrobacteraceae bacterium]